jgi:Oxidoreductase family, NAD-binding Rossmann fold
VILPGLPLRRLAGRGPNPSHEGIQHYPKGGDVTSGIRSSSQTFTVNSSQRAQLRAGVVGIGKQAIEDHIPGLQASDGAKLVAICDHDPEVVREQQYRQRVPGYTDFREMFKAEHLDLVVVATPHHVGRDVIYAAAEHGIHVLKEKPAEVTPASPAVSPARNRRAWSR